MIKLIKWSITSKFNLHINNAYRNNNLQVFGDIKLHITISFFNKNLPSFINLPFGSILLTSLTCKFWTWSKFKFLDTFGISKALAVLLLLTFLDTLRAFFEYLYSVIFFVARPKRPRVGIFILFLSFFFPFSLNCVKTIRPSFHISKYYFIHRSIDW